eukprot:TRINITY_DN57149_c0_g1_i1.p1 TRINITY_DN57149_c0_g1~~TRINITY_DN57149_c0_g1_i1.p1  ORF type:complete len:1019 (+),score=164.33 TRINITY_DN57149_c0_g1_i1:270-3326(+)
MSNLRGLEHANGYSGTNGYKCSTSSGASSGPGVYLEALREAEKTKAMNKFILRNGGDPQALIRIVEDHGGELHVLNVCTLLHRLARALARDMRTLPERAAALQMTAGWRRLMALVRDNAEILNNMELTNCLWAIATMELHDEEPTVIALLDVSMVHLSSFDPRNLSLSSWALARLGCTEKQYSWCQAFADAVLKLIDDFDNRDMTMVVWAFATIHWKSEDFLQRFCDKLVMRIETSGTQDLGNTLWALATLSFRHEGALAALCAQCFVQAEKFDQQALSISMWSLATLGYKNMNLMHHITQQCTEKINIFHSQGLSNIVWACAKFGFQQKCLLMTVAEESIPRVDEFEPQHLAIMAWSYATLEFPNRPLLTALCQAASRKMNFFHAQHMANMTWAMATLAHRDEDYLCAMVQRASLLAENFNPQECSNLAWALALLAFRNDTLLEVLSTRSQEIVESFIPQNLGNTAWAYNRMGYRDEALMRTMARQAARVLHECQGQEILDLLEAVGTGGYEEAVDPSDWVAMTSWIEHRSSGAEAFIRESAGLALEFAQLSDFDRALAVQDYRDHLTSFSVIGLGYQYTAKVLESFGVRIPEGEEMEAWRVAAKSAAAEARNDSDASKNVEAQEGLRACRTVCVYRYTLRSCSQESVMCGGTVVEQGPVGVASGQAVDAWELGLVAATLKHHRGGDGEFQALQACARSCLEELGLDPLTGSGSQAVGELWLHVSEVPCLSCVAAMAQFRRLFPSVALNVTFSLGRQPMAASIVPAHTTEPTQNHVGDHGDSGSTGASAASKLRGSGSETNSRRRRGVPAPLPSPQESRRSATTSRLAAAAGAGLYSASSAGFGFGVSVDSKADRMPVTAASSWSAQSPTEPLPVHVAEHVTGPTKSSATMVEAEKATTSPPGSLLSEAEVKRASAEGQPRWTPAGSAGQSTADATSTLSPPCAAAAPSSAPAQSPAFSAAVSTNPTSAGDVSSPWNDFSAVSSNTFVGAVSPQRWLAGDLQGPGPVAPASKAQSFY